MKLKLVKEVSVIKIFQDSKIVYGMNHGILFICAMIFKVLTLGFKEC